MKQILKDNLLPSAQQLFSPDKEWYFLHDNDKKFHSHVVQRWLESKSWVFDYSYGQKFPCH